MATVMTERDETTGTNPHRYHHTRTVEIGGRLVRAHVQRDFYLNQSRAVAEVLTDRMTWTELAADAPSGWWHNTPPPGPDLHDPARFLHPVTDSLLRRAAKILTDQPATTALSPGVCAAIRALLAPTEGHDVERHIEPEEIVRAAARSGALRVVEHVDGGVTFTTAHREDCPFITSNGAQECAGSQCAPPSAGDRAGRERTGPLPVEDVPMGWPVS